MRRLAGAAPLTAAVFLVAIACGTLSEGGEAPLDANDGAAEAAADDALAPRGDADAGACAHPFAHVGLASRFVNAGDPGAYVRRITAVVDPPAAAWITGQGASDGGLALGSSSASGAFSALVGADGGVSSFEDQVAAPSNGDQQAFGTGVAVSSGAVYRALAFSGIVTSPTGKVLKTSNAGDWESLVLRDGTQQYRWVYGYQSFAWELLPSAGEGAVIVGTWTKDVIVYRDDDTNLLDESTNFTGEQIFLARVFRPNAEIGLVTPKADGRRFVMSAAADTQAGRYYVGGRFIGGAPFVAADAGVADGDVDGDAFVAALDDDLKTRWVVTLPGKNFQQIDAVAAVPPDQGVIVAGSYAIELATSDGPVATATKGDKDLFLARYDKDGKLVWIHVLGGNGVDAVQGVAWSTKPCGERIHLTALTTSTDLDLGGFVVPGGGKKVFLAAFDGNGAFVDAVATDNATGAGPIAVDPDGRVSWAFGAAAGALSAPAVPAGPAGVAFVRFDAP